MIYTLEDSGLLGSDAMSLG